ncbi:glycosyl hydrolase family 3 protein [Pseudoscourfieldia marina]
MSATLAIMLGLVLFLLTSSASAARLGFASPRDVVDSVRGDVRGGGGYGAHHLRSSRASQLVAKMTLEEKSYLMSGTEVREYVGQTKAILRLKIPSLVLNDGPQGFRVNKQNASLPGTTTAFPCALAVTATWNENLAYQWAKSIATEFIKKGANVWLGPGLNVMRIPNGGRSFEYLSGEDPHLGAVMADATVQGSQSVPGLIATPKHFIDNNQEFNRTESASLVDGRTQRQLYLPPFASAARAGALSAMCSYNRITSEGVKFTYSCEDPQTLTGLFREEAGFKGFVMSDWGATHSTAKAIKSGLDQEMPSDDFLGAKALQEALDAKTLDEDDVDAAATRVLSAMDAAGILDGAGSGGDINANVTTPEAAALSRRIAAESTVMLTNQANILPLDANALKHVAVIGDAAQKEPIVSGGGSGYVQPPYVITHYDGIASRIRGTASYTPSGDVTAATDAASKADVAVIVVGVKSSEGSDRATLSLAHDDDALISAVADAQPRTIVIVCAPGPVLMPWRHAVASVLITPYGGQEAGNGVADVLFNDVSPSGRLPFCIPNIDNEQRWTTVQYPGVDSVMSYSERMSTGYRWYHKQGDVAPAFWFGYGLSYTKFEISDPRLLEEGSSHSIVADVANVGSRDGVEVVQLYVTWPSHSLGASEPPAQLRGYRRIRVSAGERSTVHFEVTSDMLRLWDESAGRWLVPAGTYTLYVSKDAGTLGRGITVAWPRADMLQV